MNSGQSPFRWPACWCWPPATRPQEAGSPAPPPPAEVGVVTLAPQKVEIITELPGRTAPFRAAEVRPR